MNFALGNWESGTINDLSSSANHGGWPRLHQHPFLYTSALPGGSIVGWRNTNGGGKEDEEKHGLNINHQSKPIKASRLQKGTERGEEVRKGVEVRTGKK